MIQKFFTRLIILFILDCFLNILVWYYKIWKDVKIKQMICNEEDYQMFHFTGMNLYLYDCNRKRNENLENHTNMAYLLEAVAVYKIQLFLPYIIYEAIKNCEHVFINIEETEFVVTNCGISQLKTIYTNETRENIKLRYGIKNFMCQEVKEFEYSVLSYKLIRSYLFDNYYFNSTICTNLTKNKMFNYMNHMNARVLRDLSTLENKVHYHDSDDPYEKYMPSLCLFINLKTEELTLLPTYKNMMEEEITEEFINSFKMNPWMYGFKLWRRFKYFS